jgi:hypothetical protein
VLGAHDDLEAVRLQHVRGHEVERSPFDDGIAVPAEAGQHVGLVDLARCDAVRSRRPKDREDTGPGGLPVVLRRVRGQRVAGG